MLRRPATTIQLTTADLELYEANRQRKNGEKQSRSSSNVPTEKGKEKETKMPAQKERIMGGGGGQGRQGN
ncbi:hypothetical protein P280DRAFT_414407 [Massarina eburnea CBS 473.64]|uniref:Uncharacterized protein n=1 Tax=Massarina eburnea CBS 473.64 TaxID=1395130 RepID=A0A6A6RFE5_9PLEO|nr:hypothetical protein P280DRAFT_414407 [Massarina eburnea CBS 473.64]